MKTLAIVLFTFVISTGHVIAHSGGTDANGCHAGSKPYHCH
ncbi:MAG: YHYH domain-containing protein [Pseudomonadota bacterium]